MIHFRKCLVIVCLCLLSDLHAQIQEELTPIELKQTTIITQPATLNKGFFRTGAIFSFSALDKFYDDNAKKRFLPENIWAKSQLYQLVFQYGITDRLQAILSIPFRNEFVSQSFTLEIPLTDSAAVSSWQIRGGGLSDVQAGFTWQLISENSIRRAVLFSTLLTLPTGRKDPTDVVDEQNYKIPTGSGEAALDVELLWRQVSYPFFYSFAIGYDIKFGGTKVFNVGEDPKSFRSGSLLSLNGSYNFHLNDWLAFQNDVFYFSFGEDELEGQKDDRERWSVQYIPRISFQVKRLRINQAVGFVLKGRNSSADPTYTVVIQYVF